MMMCAAVRYVLNSVMLQDLSALDGSDKPVQAKQLADVWEGTVAVSVAAYFFYSFDVITTMMTLDGAPLTLARAPYLPQGEVSVKTCWNLLNDVGGFSARGLRRGSSNIFRFFKTFQPAIESTRYSSFKTQ
eukprot:TRINITY_DN6425_c0_g1_i2.p1 TRINITY_DN6425_c0_g1~~TRINITY_DN6425_c0_g1_i2.p1  ORF type:complete len:131 (+),score=28.95 TRINITY_DN6425_c0_g1_i2:356-748(+)